MQHLVLGPKATGGDHGYENEENEISIHERPTQTEVENPDSSPEVPPASDSGIELSLELD